MRRNMKRIRQEEVDRVRQDHHKLQICTISDLILKIGVTGKAYAYEAVQIQQRDGGL